MKWGWASLFALLFACNSTPAEEPFIDTLSPLSALHVDGQGTWVLGMHTQYDKGKTVHNARFVARIVDHGVEQFSEAPVDQNDFTSMGERLLWATNDSLVSTTGGAGRDLAGESPSLIPVAGLPLSAKMPAPPSGMRFALLAPAEKALGAAGATLVELDPAGTNWDARVTIDPASAGRSRIAIHVDDTGSVYIVETALVGAGRTASIRPLGSPAAPLPNRVFVRSITVAGLERWSFEIEEAPPSVAFSRDGKLTLLFAKRLLRIGADGQTLLDTPAEGVAATPLPPTILQHSSGNLVVLQSRPLRIVRPGQPTVQRPVDFDPYAGAATPDGFVVAGTQSDGHRSTFVAVGLDAEGNERWRAPTCACFDHR